MCVHGLGCGVRVCGYAYQSVRLEVRRATMVCACERCVSCVLAVCVCAAAENPLRLRYVKHACLFSVCSLHVHLRCALLCVLGRWLQLICDDEINK